MAPGDVGAWRYNIRIVNYTGCTMEQADVLSLIAELALGLAGFSGVVTVLGRTPGVWPEVDRLRLATLLSMSLGAMMIALLAILFEQLGYSAAASWRVASALLALHGLAILLTIVPRAWRVNRDTAGITSAYSVWIFIPSVILVAVNCVVQAANVVIDPSGIRFGLLLGGLIVLLVISGVVFVRMLFVRRDLEASQ